MENDKKNFNNYVIIRNTREKISFVQFLDPPPRQEKEDGENERKKGKFYSQIKLAAERLWRMSLTRHGNRKLGRQRSARKAIRKHSQVRVH